ncbi:MAG: RsmB/NOP family class I SAM-dependent RNA methyltransferase [Planctomycetes bacterium]|nr:RsmB/NOP family class I SAM-dependent RNA methyltransferase [Planctomycetota bacterium]
MSDLEAAWRPAADAVAAWLATGRAPRDAIAADAALRRQPATVRAAAIRLARDAVAGRRRLEWLLGCAAGSPQATPLHRAAALVLARQVELGALAPTAAAARLPGPARGGTVDFAAVLRPERRFATIEDPALGFAVRHSLPDWAAVALRTQFGAEAAAVATALGGEPPRTLRANTLRVASRDELARALAAEGVVTRPAPYAPQALHVEGDADLFATASYARGAFEQQDVASQLAAWVVAPPPAGKVWDLCAGVGGKTLALAAQLQNRGEVLATDVQLHRLAALRERARRAGADNVRALPIDPAAPGAEVAAFARRADRILVDAPCSGTGSWRRRPEGRWLLGPSDLAALTAMQDALLDRAAGLLRPGARLIYATCSLLAGENEARVAALRVRRPDLEVVRLAEILGAAAARPIADATGTFLSLRPDRHGCDGFFAAVLRRPRRT